MACASIPNSNLTVTKPCLFPELVELVIDHLFDDKATLSTCSLVARSWLSPSQYHLFFSIQYDTRNDTETAHNLNKFLMSNPQCAIHIRVLHLCSSQRRFRECVEPAALSAILSALPSLTSLKISSVDVELNNVGAMEKPPFPTKIRSLHLSNIWFTSIDSLICTLRPFLHLHHVSFHNLVLLKEEDNHARLPSLLLRSVDLQVRSPYLLELVRLSCSGQSLLTTIHVTFWDKNEILVVQAVIHEHRSQLSDVTLDLTGVRWISRCFQFLICRHLE